MRTRTATLACKSTSRKDLEVNTVFRQELVPVPQLGIEAGVEVRPGVVLLEGRDRLHRASASRLQLR